MKKSSMADVARLAGVSTATVSHVINRSRYVSAEVTAKVEDAVRRLNYVPNQIARNLKTGRNDMVLFIVPDIANSFFSTAIEAVEGVLVTAGYRLVIANTKEDFGREAAHLQGTGNGMVDGVLLASTAESWDQVAPLFPGDLPSLLVDRVFPLWNSISIDSREAMEQAIRALAEKGHRKIGFISGIQRLSSTKERIEAYEQALAACGLALDRELIQFGDSMYGSSPKCCERLLNMGCTAIVASNGVMASDAAYHLAQNGVKADLVGYVDSPLQGRTESYYASITLPTEELGRRAGEEILRLIADPQARTGQILLPARFCLSSHGREAGG